MRACAACSSLLLTLVLCGGISSVALQAKEPTDVSTNNNDTQRQESIQNTSNTATRRSAPPRPLPLSQSTPPGTHLVNLTRLFPDVHAHAQLSFIMDVEMEGKIPGCTRKPASQPHARTLFAVTAQTHQLILSRSLVSSPLGTVFHLNITAMQNNTSSPPTAGAALRVRVVGAEAAAPRCVVPQTLEVPENTIYNSVLAPITLSPAPELGISVQFSVLEPSTVTHGTFAVVDGNLVLARRLDHDGSPPRVIDLVVRAKSSISNLTSFCHTRVLPTPIPKPPAVVTFDSSVVQLTVPLRVGDSLATLVAVGEDARSDYTCTLTQEQFVSNHAFQTTASPSDTQSGDYLGSGSGTELPLSTPPPAPYLFDLKHSRLVLAQPVNTSLEGIIRATVTCCDTRQGEAASPSSTSTASGASLGVCCTAENLQLEIMASQVREPPLQLQPTLRLSTLLETPTQPPAIGSAGPMQAAARAQQQLMQSNEFSEGNRGAGEGASTTGRAGAGEAGDTRETRGKGRRTATEATTARHAYAREGRGGGEGGDEVQVLRVEATVTRHAVQSLRVSTQVRPQGPGAPQCMAHVSDHRNMEEDTEEEKGSGSGDGMAWRATTVASATSKLEMTEAETESGDTAATAVPTSTATLHDAAFDQASSHCTIIVNCFSVDYEALLLGQFSVQLSVSTADNTHTSVVHQIVHVMDANDPPTAVLPSRAFLPEALQTPASIGDLLIVDEDILPINRRNTPEITASTAGVYTAAESNTLQCLTAPSYETDPSVSLEVAVHWESSQQANSTSGGGAAVAAHSKTKPTAFGLELLVIDANEPPVLDVADSGSATPLLAIEASTAVVRETLPLKVLDDDDEGVPWGAVDVIVEDVLCSVPKTTSQNASACTLGSGVPSFEVVKNDAGYGLQVSDTRGTAAPREYVVALRAVDGGGLCSREPALVRVLLRLPVRATSTISSSSRQSSSPGSSTTTPAAMGSTSGLSKRYAALVGGICGGLVLVAVVVSTRIMRARCHPSHHADFVATEGHKASTLGTHSQGSMTVGQRMALSLLHFRDSSTSTNAVYAELFNEPIGSFIIHNDGAQHRLFLKATTTECRRYAIAHRRKGHFQLESDDSISQPKFETLEDLVEHYTQPRACLPVPLTPAIQETCVDGEEQRQEARSDTRTFSATPEPAHNSLNTSLGRRDRGTSGKGRLAVAYKLEMSRGNDKETKPHYGEDSIWEDDGASDAARNTDGYLSVAGQKDSLVEGESREYELPVPWSGVGSAVSEYSSVEEGPLVYEEPVGVQHEGDAFIRAIDRGQETSLPIASYQPFNIPRSSASRTSRKKRVLPFAAPFQPHSGGPTSYAASQTNTGGSDNGTTTASRVSQRQVSLRQPGQPEIIDADA